jgi:hypothetical protein
MKYFKITKILILSLFIQSCSSSFIGKRFVFYDYFKDLDLELTLYKDSTFVLKDEYGRRKMSQKGKWKMEISDYDSTISTQTLILTDTIKPQIFIDLSKRKWFIYKSNYDNKEYSIREDYFPLISQDTVILLNNKNLILRKLNFKVEHGNIEKKKILQAEKFYIKVIGKENYIKSLGEGISVEKARENLKKCY